MSTFSIGQMNELGNSLENAGYSAELVKKLNSGDTLAQIRWVLEGTAEIVKTKFIVWLGKTIEVPATQESFVAKEKFQRNSTEVKFNKILENFRQWFLTSDGKIEEPMSPQTLRYGKLVHYTSNDLIIKELGGEVKAETALTELWHLLRLQAKGQDGILLTNGYANIFYVRDTEAVLRVLRVNWYGGGWVVDTLSVECSRGWSEGRRVFSRNS